MGRPRKTTATLKLHGAFRADRHGGGEPTPAGALKRPKFTDANAAWLWDTHARQFAANGASGGDSALALSACEWWGMYRSMQDKIRGGDDDYRTFVKLSMAWKNFASAAAKLGLSPADRAKLRVEPPRKTTVAKRRRGAS